MSKWSMPIVQVPTNLTELPSNSAASTTTDVAVIEDAAESKKVTKTGEWTP